MSWSEVTWKRAEKIYGQIVTMPFINGLIDGSLSKDRFNFYIAQDAKYLEGFGRALALIAARAHRKNDVLDFVRFSESAIVVENALHSIYLNDYELASQEVSPTCHHYNNFLISVAATSQVEIAMAAVLPCFWIYKEVGDFILQNQIDRQNPYQSWINTYSGEEFSVAVKKAINICDEVAATLTDDQRELMTDAFCTACRLEWMFWDSAWRMEKWLVDFG